MSEGRGREEIQARMGTGLGSLLEALDALSEAQLVGPVDAAGWNARDHIGHLASWAEGIAALVRRENRWAAMGLSMDEPEGDEPDYDVMNAELREKCRALTPQETRRWLVAAHGAVVDAMAALTHSDLGQPYERFVAPFTGSWGEPISEYILGNTEDHYSEHLPWLLAIANENAQG